MGLQREDRLIIETHFEAFKTSGFASALATRHGKTHLRRRKPNGRLSSAGQRCRDRPPSLCCRAGPWASPPPTTGALVSATALRGR